MIHWHVTHLVPLTTNQTHSPKHAALFKLPGLPASASLCCHCCVHLLLLCSYSCLFISLLLYTVLHDIFRLPAGAVLCTCVSLSPTLEANHHPRGKKPATYPKHRLAQSMAQTPLERAAAPGTTGRVSRPSSTTRSLFPSGQEKGPSCTPNSNYMLLIINILRNTWVVWLN